MTIIPPENRQLEQKNSVNHPDKLNVLMEALADLARGEVESASARISAGYPFEPRERRKRSWTQRRALSVFLRDGFVDRYTSERLVYPGALRVLSLLVPRAFPAHPNWKMSETHMAYWELFPTLDHILPIGRGGADTDENLVTTSMLHNQAKSSWTLDELGWKLYPAGNATDWDGLLIATSSLIEARPELLNDKYLRGWHNAAMSIVPPNKAMQAGPALDRPSPRR